MESHDASTVQTSSSFAFGIPTLQFAPFSQYGTASHTSTSFGAPSAGQTGFGSVQAPQPQHKRQPSLQGGIFSFSSANKVPRSGENTSPTDGRLFRDGTPSRSVRFGTPESEIAAEDFSFPSSRSQTNGDAAVTPINSAFVPRAVTSTTANSFNSSNNFRLSSFGSCMRAVAQSRPFAVPTIFSSSSTAEKKGLALPQYGLLGFDLDNCNDEGKPEPILSNTNSPHSVFLCGSQGSGKSYTLSCMLENHLLCDTSVGTQKQTIPGFIFDWDTNTSGSLAEAASLCSRGINVRLLVSWSNCRQMKALYENYARRSGGRIEVRPLLFEDTELTVGNIRNLMAFRESSHATPLYLEVIQNILRKVGRKSETFSVKAFLSDLESESFGKTQLDMLELRLNIFKTFSAVTAPDVVAKDYKGCDEEQIKRKLKNLGLDFTGDCIRVEHGTLTIFDLSDPFVDASTACALFDICLAISLKRHKEAVTAKKISPGLIITLDEAHKFFDTSIPSADVFTASLLTTIRE